MVTAIFSTVLLAQEVEKITVVECCEKNIYPEKYINIGRDEVSPFTQKDIYFYFDAAMLLYSENKYPYKSSSSFDPSNLSIEFGMKVGNGYFWDSTIFGVEFENENSNEKNQYQRKKRSLGISIKDFQYSDDYSSYLKYFFSYRDSERYSDFYSLNERLFGAGFEMNYTFHLFLKLYVGLSVGGQVNAYYNYDAAPYDSARKNKKDFGVYQGYEYWYEIPISVRVAQGVNLNLVNRYKEYSVDVTPSINDYPMLYVSSREYSTMFSVEILF